MGDWGEGTHGGQMPAETVGGERGSLQPSGSKHSNYITVMKESILTKRRPSPTLTPHCRFSQPVTAVKQPLPQPLLQP